MSIVMPGGLFALYPLSVLRGFVHAFLVPNGRLKRGKLVVPEALLPLPTAHASIRGVFGASFRCPSSRVVMGYALPATSDSFALPNWQRGGR